MFNLKKKIAKLAVYFYRCETKWCFETVFNSAERVENYYLVPETNALEILRNEKLVIES